MFFKRSVFINIAITFDRNYAAKRCEDTGYVGDYNDLNDYVQKRTYLR